MSFLRFSAPSDASFHQLISFFFGTVYFYFYFSTFFISNGLILKKEEVFSDGCCISLKKSSIEVLGVISCCLITYVLI